MGERYGKHDRKGPDHRGAAPGPDPGAGRRADQRIRRQGSHRGGRAEGRGHFLRRHDP